MGMKENTGQNTEPRRAMRKDSPCKDCKTRVSGCHGKCNAYLQWAAERRAVTAKETELRVMLHSSSGDGTSKYIQRRRKKNRR